VFNSIFQHNIRLLTANKKQMAFVNQRVSAPVTWIGDISPRILRGNTIGKTPMSFKSIEIAHLTES